SMPGDIPNATAQLPNIGTCPNGDGNLRVGADNGGGMDQDAWTEGSQAENVCFFGDLSGAGLITGISSPGQPAFGQGLPLAKLGNGLVVAYESMSPWKGLYAVTLEEMLNPSQATGTNAMTPGEAGQIDRKIDDGYSNTGAVLGVGVVGSCENPSGDYAETVTSKDCDISYLLQQ
ncbi:MAG: hypothetical protein KGI57_09410, partial [Hyphomicrobiales bacterium]|nr:hypothetical protein [Hyphomicrobiales bacterium]